MHTTLFVGAVRSLSVAALAVVVVFAAPAKASIVIDDFTSVGSPSSWPVTLTTNSSVSFTETGLATVLGGSRTSTIATNAIGIPGFDFITATIASGSFGYAGSINAVGNVTLMYDGGDGDLNVDMSGESGIMLSPLWADAGIFPSFITLTISDGVETDTHSFLLENEFGPPLPFFFSQFANDVDLSSINSIRLDFQSTNAVDFQLGGIETFAIPAPASLALLVAAGVHRRRRRG